jgi:glycosyltransferase involved in cell wall biosynthesis
MAAYNGEKYIAEQLSSIANQSLKPAAIVVVDDGSRDSTCQIVREFSAQMPILFHINETNLGPTATFARAVQLSPQCDWIAFSDQDDVWLPTKLAELADSAAKQNVSGIFSDAEVVDSDLAPLPNSSQWGRVGFAGNKSDLFGQLVRFNVVTGATFMLKRELALKHQPIPIGWIHDYWLALHLAAHNQLGICPKRLIKYRQHGGNLIGSAANDFAGRTRSAVTKKREAYLVELERFTELKFSLGQGMSAQTSALLEAKIAHLQFRAAISELGIVQSTCEVLRKTLRGDYHRLDRGLFSALKDLARV